MNAKVLHRDMLTGAFSGAISLHPLQRLDTSVLHSWPCILSIDLVSPKSHSPPLANTHKHYPLLSLQFPLGAGMYPVFLFVLHFKILVLILLFME